MKNEKQNQLQSDIRELTFLNLRSWYDNYSQLRYTRYDPEKRNLETTKVISTISAYMSRANIKKEKDYNYFLSHQDSITDPQICKSLTYP